MMKRLNRLVATTALAGLMISMTTGAAAAADGKADPAAAPAAPAGQSSGPTDDELMAAHRLELPWGFDPCRIDSLPA